MKQKTPFLINLTGFSAGLFGALLIYMWVSDEFAFDKFHKKGPRLFQVMKIHMSQAAGIVIFYRPILERLLLLL